MAQRSECKVLKSIRYDEKFEDLVQQAISRINDDILKHNLVVGGNFRESQHLRILLEIGVKSVINDGWVANASK